MITELGIVAGEVWQVLDQHGEVSFSRLVSEIPHHARDSILMSVGWLAREGHVIVREEGKDFLLTLRRP